MRKPRIVVSRCLGFAACRWDGRRLNPKFIKALKGRAMIITVCPEVAIGLGVPRPKIKIVTKAGRRRLIQPKTGRDLTTAIDRFCRKFLSSLGRVDGFILKSRSPSCDIKKGFFGLAARKRYPAAVFSNEKCSNGIRY